MIDIERLLPCPFCGGKATTFHIPKNNKKEMEKHPNWKWNYPGMWIIGCDTEMCIGNINHFAMIFTDEKTAVQTWNKRVYPEQPKVSRWIPCNEKLPETGKKVLVCCGILGERDIAIAQMYEYKNEKYWNIKTAVHAWQPLPEDYQS